MSRSNSKGKFYTSPKTKKGGGGLTNFLICKVCWYLSWWTSASPTGRAQDAFFDSCLGSTMVALIVDTDSRMGYSDSRKNKQL